MRPKEKPDYEKGDLKRVDGIGWLRSGAIGTATVDYFIQANIAEAYARKVE